MTAATRWIVEAEWDRVRSNWLATMHPTEQEARESMRSLIEDDKPDRWRLYRQTTDSLEQSGEWENEP